MPELPNLVIRKLAEREPPPGAPHPDPDLLTAFVERSLPDRDRSAILAHLADCAPCREVAALARPPAVTYITFSTPKRPRSLFFLRWGALAACAVVAISAALLHQRKPNEPSLLARNQISVPAPAPTPAQESKASTSETNTPESPAPVSRHKETAAAQPNDFPPRPPLPENGNAGVAAQKAALGGNATSSNSDLPLKGRADSQPSQLKPGATTDAGSAAAAQTAGTIQTPVLMQEQANSVGQQAEKKAEKQATPASANTKELADSLAKAPAASAAEAISAETEARAATSTTTGFGSNNKDDYRASSAPIANLDLATARHAATWHISPEGRLQRSLDGGKTWESSAAVNPTTRLRVVTATGFQVWAAGNNGILIHSQDSGSHFTTVKVHQKHATLKGDIVALTFPDAQTGRLETADHQVWTTTDAGKTWQPTALSK